MNNKPNYKDSIIVFILLFFVSFFSIFFVSRYFIINKILIQVLVYLCLGLVPVSYTVLNKWDVKLVFGIKKPRIKDFLAAFLLIVGTMFCVYMLLRWATPFIPQIESDNFILVKDIKNNFLLSLFILVLLPAFFEEIVFRGFILSGLQNSLNNFWAIIGCSLFFALLHFDFNKLVFILIPSFSISWAMVNTKSIFIPIFMHFINNLYPVIKIVFFINSKFFLYFNNVKFQIFTFFVGLALVFFGFVLLNQKSLPSEHDTGVKLDFE